MSSCGGRISRCARGTGHPGRGRVPKGHRRPAPPATRRGRREGRRRPVLRPGGPEARPRPAGSPGSCILCARRENQGPWRRNYAKGAEVSWPGTWGRSRDRSPGRPGRCTARRPVPRGGWGSAAPCKPPPALIGSGGLGGAGGAEARTHVRHDTHRAAGAGRGLSTDTWAAPATGRPAERRPQAELTQAPFLSIAAIASHPSLTLASCGITDCPPRRPAGGPRPRPSLLLPWPSLLPSGLSSNVTSLGKPVLTPPGDTATIGSRDQRWGHHGYFPLVCPGDSHKWPRPPSSPQAPGP